MKKDKDAKRDNEEWPWWKVKVQRLVCWLEIHFDSEIRRLNLPNEGSSVFVTEIAPAEKRRKAPQQEWLPKDTYTETRFWNIVKVLNMSS